MDQHTIIKNLFVFFLTFTFFLSIYIIVKVFGDNAFYDVYTDWQVPMLLALYLEMTRKRTIYDSTLISQYFSRKKK